MPRCVVSGIRPRFQGLSQSEGQVAHVLLTRSPLIRPANWSSPFDLHVLSTPPAFVLSQNQTLRKCQQATHPPKRAGNRHNETTNPPLTKEPVNQIRLSQEPHHPRTKAPRSPLSTTNPHKRGPSWHRLLGTLLSSQGTDAHPARTLRATREAVSFKSRPAGSSPRARADYDPADRSEGARSA